MIAHFFSSDAPLLPPALLPPPEEEEPPPLLPPDWPDSVSPIFIEAALSATILALSTSASSPCGRGVDVRTRVQSAMLAKMIGVH